MSKLILTRGVPASGKSTWAKAWVAEDPERRARLNRDDYRAMIFGVVGVGTFPQEKAVSYAQQTAAKGLLNAGVDVVIDDTNLRAKFVKMWLGFTDDVEFMDFPIDIDEAYERDQHRECSVGPTVLKSFFERFIGKDGISLPPVPVLDTTAQFKQVAPHDPWLTDAIIVDIDGTLAHMGERSPYDGTRYHEDTLDQFIHRIVKDYYHMGTRVLVTSGRDAKHRTETEDWLNKHKIPYDALIMRPEDDTRKDDVVKDELYERHIADKYNVLFALDDRDRVVDMWRAKGIKCLQVQPGNF